MKLLATLQSGINGAGNGTATLHQRGSSNNIAYYLDHSGQVPVSAGTVVLLDAYGKATVYVGETCRVQVYDSSGTRVADFVEGDALGSIETISSSVVGVDYDTGQSGLSRPTTLQEAMDKWIIDNLAPIWKVKVGDTTATIPEFLGAIIPECFNVKNPAYAGGAIGDGVTDDTAKIQATIAAATAAGGYVCFPPGTYLFSEDLSVPSTVSLKGSGAGVTKLLSANANVHFPGLLSQEQSVSGLAFDFTEAESSKLLLSWYNANLLLLGCVFNSDENAGLHVLGSVVDGSVTRFRVRMDRCLVRSASSAAAARYGVTTLPVAVSKQEFEAHNCFFVGPEDGNLHIALAVRGARVTDCTFDYSAASNYSSSTVNSPIVFGGNGGLVSGCDFVEPAAEFIGSIYCIGVTPVGSSAVMTEEANRFGSGDFPDQFLAYSQIHTSAELRSRADRFLVVSGDDDEEFVADFSGFGVVTNERTEPSAQTVQFTMGPEGGKALFVVDNIEGDADTIITWGTGITGLNDSETVVDGTVRTFQFYFYRDGSAIKARQIGSEEASMCLTEVGVVAAGVGTATFDATSILEEYPDDCAIACTVTAAVSVDNEGTQFSCGIIPLCLRVTGGVITHAQIENGITGGGENATNYVHSMGSSQNGASNSGTNNFYSAAESGTPDTQFTLTRGDGSGTLLAVTFTVCFGPHVVIVDD